MKRLFIAAITVIAAASTPNLFAGNESCGSQKECEYSKKKEECSGDKAENKKDATADKPEKSEGKES